MQLRLLVFSHAADRTGFRERIVDYTSGETPRQILLREAPTFDPTGVRIAMDGEYWSWDEPIADDTQELALIPPVSGG